MTLILTSHEFGVMQSKAEISTITNYNTVQCDYVVIAEMVLFTIGIHSDP